MLLFRKTTGGGGGVGGSGIPGTIAQWVDSNTLGSFPLGSSNQILVVNSGATGLEYKTLQGTTNQIIITHGVGYITLSTPQDIAPSSSPTFTGLTLSGLTQGSILFAGTGGVISQDNDNLFWDNTNKRLGIGTTTPSQRLTVTGNIGIQAGANAFIGTLDNFSLSLRTNNTDRIFITAGGNVGIGTTAPASILELSRTNTSPILTITSATSTTYSPQIAFRTGTTPITRYTIGTNIDDNKLKIVAGSDITTSTGITIDSSGNVGIGTTNPVYKLDINGALRLQPGSAPTLANGVIYYDNTENKFKFAENNTWKELGSGADTHLQINTQTGNYTLVLSDDGKLINMNSSSALTLTVPTNASVPFPIGTRIYVRKGGTGNVTISGASGVRINAPFGNTITTQYQTVSLLKIDTNTWDLIV